MEIEEEFSDNNQVQIKKETFINIRRSLKHSYEFIKSLGKGGYGKVFQVGNKNTGQLFACKKLSKLNVNNLIKFKREINILQKMDHPNIIKLYDLFESKNSLYLIMEECHGGELFDRISKRKECDKMYSEKEACEIIQQVMSAIDYCHKQGIAHRDLKPENILYLTEGSEINNTIKIIDFGLSKEINTRKSFNSLIGTIYYVSPEILKGHYSEKCDVWAAGVILYVLLSGEPPFNGINDNIIFSQIRQLKFNFPEKKWNKISKDAKDLLSKIFVPESQRLSARQVLEHSWFQLVKDNKISLEKIKLDGTRNFFKEYKESNRLKRIVLLYIASKLQEEEILDLNKIFKAFDKNNDGQIDYKEFEQGIIRLNSKGIKKEEIQSYFNEIDSDNNKKIDYTEFIAATLQKNIFLKKEKLYDAFTALDKDKNGKIAKSDLMGVLKMQPQHDHFVNELIKSADKNGDGFIDYKEFVEMMEYNGKV